MPQWDHWHQWTWNGIYTGFLSLFSAWFALEVNLYLLKFWHSQLYLSGILGLAITLVFLVLACLCVISGWMDTPEERSPLANIYSIFCVFGVTGSCVVCLILGVTEFVVMFSYAWTCYQHVPSDEPEYCSIEFGGMSEVGWSGILMLIGWCLSAGSIALMHASQSFVGNLW